MLPISCQYFTHVASKSRPYFSHLNLGKFCRNGAPIDRYNLCGIAHARTNRKDDIFYAKKTSAKLYIYI